MLIGYSKKDNKKIRLKDYKANLNGKELTYTKSNDDNDFTHYLYMYPSKHHGFKIIHKSNVINVREATDKDLEEEVD